MDVIQKATKTLVSGSDSNANAGNCTERAGCQKLENVAANAETSGENNSSDPINPSEQNEDIMTSYCRRLALQQGVKSLDDHAQENLSSAFAMPWFLTRRRDGSSPGGFSLVKFVTACIASQLKSLGIDELDCKELVDTWLSHRRQRRWGQSVYKSATIFPNQSRPTSNSCLQAHQLGMTNLLAATDRSGGDFKPGEIFGPSEPNSSLLRLSEEGNVELGHFLSRMEEVRGNTNNACCTLLQSLSLLMLPYLKLLSGNQLETTCSLAYMQDLRKIIAMMAVEVNSDKNHKKATEMIQRELRIIETNAKALHKVFSKMHKKCKELYEENDKISSRALSQIHPKGMEPYHKGRIHQAPKYAGGLSLSRTFLSDCIQFSHIPLYHANFTAGEICKNHLLLSKSREGSLVYKNDLDEEWKLFTGLSFNKRRDMFLSVAEDIQWSLKQSLSTASHVKELIKEGYPENIYEKITENLAYLKATAKHSDDIIVLSKVSIVTQVHSLREASGRLVRVLRDASQISKLYYKCIKLAKEESIGSGVGCLPFPRKKKQSPNVISTAQHSALKFDTSKVKLLIPLPTPRDPLMDLYSIT